MLLPRMHIFPTQQLVFQELRICSIVSFDSLLLSYTWFFEWISLNGKKCLSMLSPLSKGLAKEAQRSYYNLTFWFWWWYERNNQLRQMEYSLKIWGIKKYIIGNDFMHYCYNSIELIVWIMILIKCESTHTSLSILKQQWMSAWTLRFD